LKTEKTIHRRISFVQTIENNSQGGALQERDGNSSFSILMRKITGIAGRLRRLLLFSRKSADSFGEILGNRTNATAGFRGWAD
jgi:hypothetical protein